MVSPSGTACPGNSYPGLSNSNFRRDESLPCSPWHWTRHEKGIHLFRGPEMTPVIESWKTTGFIEFRVVSNRREDVQNLFVIRGGITNSVRCQNW